MDEVKDEVVQAATKVKKEKKVKEVKEKKVKEVKEKDPKIEQNDITRPKAGTTTGSIWDIADQKSSELNAPVERKVVLEIAKEKGINAATAATQYGKWRKFHGLVREVKIKVPKEPKNQEVVDQDISVEAAA